MSKSKLKPKIAVNIEPSKQTVNITEIIPSRKPSDPEDDQPSLSPKGNISWGRSNYYKYSEVKARLIDMLRTGDRSAKDVAGATDISVQSTFQKYKSIAQLETGLLLMTKEESDYLKTKLSPDEFRELWIRIANQNEPR